jgi:hypothetical protein
MTSIHRTSRTPGTPVSPSSLNGKEGVVGSSPTEGLQVPPSAASDLLCRTPIGPRVSCLELGGEREQPAFAGGLADELHGER